VTLKYGDTVALDEFSMKLEQGEQLGICGRTGSGKTSILNMLFNGYKPQEGYVSFNGRNIREYGESIRNHISYISQDPFIIEGTLRDNLDLENELLDEDIKEEIERYWLQYEVLE
jgi:ABC-type multidrug transport system fused ATPase/permease subunit